MKDKKQNQSEALGSENGFIGLRGDKKLWSKFVRHCQGRGQKAFDVLRPFIVKTLNRGKNTKHTTAKTTVKNM